MFKMSEELRDAIEVPGHVLAWTSKSEAISRAREILAEWESKGWHKLKEVPEGAKKEQFRDIMRSLGQNVRF